MNVLVLNNFASVGSGADAVATASARGLALRGHRVIYFSTDEPFGASLAFLQVSRLVKIDLEAAGVEVISASGHSPRSPAGLVIQRTWNSAAAASLRRLLADLDPRQTIVHLHSWANSLSPSVARAAVRRRFKLVCTLHDCSVACPRGAFFNHRRMEQCQLKPLSWACVACNCDNRGYFHKVGRALRQVIQISVGKIPSGVDAFIVVSRFSKMILKPYLPERSPVFEVPNPIDVRARETY